MAKDQNYSIARLDDVIEGLPRLEALAGILGNHKDTAYYQGCFDRRGDLDIFVVQVDGQDVGYCLLNYAPKYKGFSVLNIPEIQDLNIIPAFRRQGLGRSLIEHCEYTARNKGYAQMGIGVGLNKDFGPAQRLYVLCGYVPDGQGAVCDRVPVCPNEIRAVDDQMCLMMTKSLGP